MGAAGPLRRRRRQRGGGLSVPGPPDDNRYMREAIALSARGAGRVSPNPLVGAVVVREGEVIATGWHERFGSGHAEANALAAAGEAARGATLYVTLEPCCHEGKTPPCTATILRSGVARVVYACADPNPVACGGAEFLSARGVTVTGGVCAREAALANAAYLKWMRTGRPLVHAKIATSLDGRITGPTGRGERITGPEAWAVVHRLRAESDAVLVGVGTVLADDPLLTPRGPEGPRRPGYPVRVVLDTRGRMPERARLCESATPEQPVLVLMGAAAAASSRLPHEGLEVAACALGADGRIDLAAALDLLGRRSLLSVLVEPGTGLATNLFGHGLVDRVTWFHAPVLLGEQGKPALGSLGLGGVGEAPSLEAVTREEVGRDLCLNGWLPGLTWLDG